MQQIWHLQEFGQTHCIFASPLLFENHAGNLFVGVASTLLIVTHTGIEYDFAATSRPVYATPRASQQRTRIHKGMRPLEPAKRL